MIISNDQLKWYGRCLDSDGVRFFNWTCSGFEFAFTGTKATATIISDASSWGKDNFGWLSVFTAPLDQDYPDEPSLRIELASDSNTCVLFENTKPETVKIRVMKTSEDAFGMAGLKCLEVEGKKKKLPVQKKDLKIEYIGDSITCGYGIDGVWEKDVFRTEIERADKGYAFLTAKKLNAEYHMISWSGIGLTSAYVDPAVDLPDSEWTMARTWPYTDKSACKRLKKDPEAWDSSKYVPDLVVINLGTNDQSYTRGKETRIRSFINVYRILLEEVHRRTPGARIMCCLGVMGQDLCPAVEAAVEKFRAEFPAADVKTLRFPVQDEKDGIAADWHPSAETHRKMAEQLSDAIKNW